MIQILKSQILYHVFISKVKYINMAYDQILVHHNILNKFLAHREHVSSLFIQWSFFSSQHYIQNIKGHFTKLWVLPPFPYFLISTWTHWGRISVSSGWYPIIHRHPQPSKWNCWGSVPVSGGWEGFIREQYSSAIQDWVAMGFALLDLG